MLIFIGLKDDREKLEDFMDDMEDDENEENEERNEMWKDYMDTILLPMMYRPKDKNDFNVVEMPELIGWLEKTDDFVFEHVNLVEYNDNNRAMFAKNIIEENTEIIFIPKSHLVTQEDVENYPPNFEIKLLRNDLRSNFNAFYALWYLWEGQDD